MSTGIIDEDVDLSEVVQGSLDDFVSELYRVVVGNGNSSLGLDLLDNDISSRAVFSLSDGWGAEVIDDNFSSSAGEEQCVGLSESSSSACDDDDLISELKSHFVVQKIYYNDIIDIRNQNSYLNINLSLCYIYPLHVTKY